MRRAINPSDAWKGGRQRGDASAWRPEGTWIENHTSRAPSRRRGLGPVTGAALFKDGFCRRRNKPEQDGERLCLHWI